MNEIQATNEALLLTLRKLRRFHPEAFADVMSRLPEPARVALRAAENAADSHRDSVGVANIEWPADPDADA